jgi:hypothetical protein
MGEKRARKPKTVTLESIAAQLTSMDLRFNALDQRLDKVDDRIGKLDTRMENSFAAVADDNGGRHRDCSSGKGFSQSSVLVHRSVDDWSQIAISFAGLQTRLSHAARHQWVVIFAVPRL